MYRIYYTFLNEELATEVIFESEAQAKKRVQWLNDNVKVKLGEYIYKEEVTQ